MGRILSTTPRARLEAHIHGLTGARGAYVGKQRSVIVTRRRPPAASGVLATAGRVPRIDIARDLGLRARLAGHLPTSTPQARVYITRHPPPQYPQITAYKANFIGTCMQYSQGGRNAPQPTRPDCFDIQASCS